MPFNGSGGTTQPAGSIYPATANTLIESAKANTSIADLYTMLAGVITKDGQTTATLRIPFALGASMGSQTITAVGDGTATTHAATVGQVRSGASTLLGTVAGTNTITAALSPALTAYASGQQFLLTPAATNTAATTINIDSVGAKNIFANGAACVGGELVIGVPVEIAYDGTQFNIIGMSVAITQFTEDTSPDSANDFVVTYDASAKLNKKVKLSNVASGGYVSDFRLTLTTGVPVTTADVTAAGTLYCAPYVGNRIALYSGTAWNVRTSAQFSLALTLTSGKPYDVFCYDNAGTPTLEVLVWTNDTTRATALTTQDGVLVKTGDATRRYMGTLYASGANTTEDSKAKRYLWNYYNRRPRSMAVVDTTDTWTYTTATYRQARATAANQLDYVVGLDEDAVKASVVATANNTSAEIGFRVGVGVDSTSVNSATLTAGGSTNGANTFGMGTAEYSGYPGAGRHVLVWLELSIAIGTTTWAGDNGAGLAMQSGIRGEVFA